VKILLAEDEAVSRRVLTTMLSKWGYEATVVSDGLAAWQVLQHPAAPQLAILDWMMPGMDGLQVCRAVRQLGAEPYTYILLLTSRNRKEDIVTGLEAGADDYVTKPFDAHELQVRLRAGRRILDLQTELITAREIQRQQAMHDVLTGALNRGTILENLKRELSRARRDDAQVGVIMVDLDHFKWINDTYGHLVGDMVLREFAFRTQNLLRQHDLVGRYGGEEFLVVLPSCNALEAAQVAERIREGLAAIPISTPDTQILVTASFGVTASHGTPEEDVDSLLRAADTALYRAKKEGRNRVVFGQEREEGHTLNFLSLSPPPSL
jgi:diguanylate cyclase (GGDEF)-like protein